MFQHDSTLSCYHTTIFPVVEKVVMSYDFPGPIFWAQLQNMWSYVLKYGIHDLCQTIIGSVLWELKDICINQ